MEETSQKEKVKIPRQMPIEQKPEVRIQNFEEVSKGFTEELALREAQRCLDCKKPFCVDGCPVNIRIPEFIKFILQKDYIGAVRKIKESNYLPAICGRVCPQENLCEKQCVLSKKFKPVSIGKLERFAADQEIAQRAFAMPDMAPPNGKKVAMIGGGPSGLICSAELAKKGYEVTIFEALHAAGGVLIYGIPEFRLPKFIVKNEVERVQKIGVKVIPNFVVGRTATVDELFQEFGFSAIFLGTGAGAPNFMNIPGESLIGIYSANEFLTRVNLMKAYRFPEYDTPVKIGKKVAVIGGGNTAMDSARCSLRLGADKVMLVYRRAREEMPARIEEVHHAQEEGIEFHLLTNPIKFLGDDNGMLKAMECIKMELGEPDSSGRRRPIPIQGSEHVLEADTVILAVGQSPNAIIQQTTPGLNFSKWGTLIVDEKKASSRKGIYAGGDLVRGGATVIDAVHDGKKAAAAIDEFLKNGTHQ